MLRSILVALDDSEASKAAQVYEYVPDMEKALAEARRVLRTGGRAVSLETGEALWDTESIRVPVNGSSVPLVEYLRLKSDGPFPTKAAALADLDRWEKTERRFGPDYASAATKRFIDQMRAYWAAV